MLYKITRPIYFCSGQHTASPNCWFSCRSQTYAIIVKTSGYVQVCSESLVPDGSSLSAFRISGECVTQNWAIAFAVKGQWRAAAMQGERTFYTHAAPVERSALRTICAPDTTLTRRDQYANSAHYRLTDTLPFGEIYNKSLRAMELARLARLLLKSMDIHKIKLSN